MDYPPVSIIIPCHNSEHDIGEAIESALQQTYSNVEIIVIDDGSTDNSLDIIKSFGDRIRWKSIENSGACAARNRGLEIATGEFVQFLDADDLLEHDKIDRHLTAIIDSGADFVFGDWRISTSDNDTRIIHASWKDGDDPVTYSLYHSILISSPLHRAEALRKVNGFREHLPCAQERDLHIRLACKGASFKYVSGVTFTARKQEDSVSSNYLRVLNQHSEIAANAYQTLVDNDMLTEERRRALAGFLARDARMYLQRGETDKAKAYFAEARSFHAEGGLHHAFESPLRHTAARVLGPELAEKLIGMSERLRP